MKRMILTLNYSSLLPGSESEFYEFTEYGEFVLLFKLSHFIISGDLENSG